MATARFTLGAVLSAAAETAQTFVTTATTINTAIGMVGSYVNNAAESQRIRQAMAAHNNTHAIATEVAMEMIQREDAVEAYINGDSAKEAKFNKHHDELMALVNKA